MSEINILQLPDHVLSKILGFVEDPFIVASVCKRFYEVDCRRTQKMLVLNIDDDAVEDKKIRQSILKSKRVCSKTSICAQATQQSLTFIKEAFAQHGESIDAICLSFLHSELTEMDLIELLNLLPNLEALYLNVTLAEDGRSQKRARLALSLPKLRKVSSKNCSGAMFLTKYLGKDSLDTLDVLVRFKDEYEEGFGDLIKKQQSIKHISGSFQLRCLKYFGGLQLESLQIIFTLFRNLEEDVTDVCNFLKSQTDLKSLSFGKVFAIEDNMIMEICKVKTLEQLEISISQVPHVLIRNLCNLTNLKVLKVFSAEKMPIIALSHLRLKYLEKLEVTHDFRLRLKTQKRFEKNFAGVKLQFERF